MKGCVCHLQAHKAQDAERIRMGVLRRDVGAIPITASREAPFFSTRIYTNDPRISI